MNLARKDALKVLCKVIFWICCFFLTFFGRDLSSLSKEFTILPLFVVWRSVSMDYQGVEPADRRKGYPVLRSLQLKFETMVLATSVDAIKLMELIARKRGK